MRRLIPAALVAALLVAGCGQGGRTQQPRDGHAGLQLTGTLLGRQVAVSDGSPNLVVDDCDPVDGPDDDVCAQARDVDGELFVLVFENPEVLVGGADLRIGGDCGPGAACDAVEDVAVVRVQRGAGRRLPVTGGELRLTLVEPGRRRYVGSIRLELAGGNLSGTFDLVPRPED